MDEDIIKIVNDHEKRIKALEGKREDEGHEVKGARAKSINEFLLETKASGNVEKVVVFGNYLEQHRSMECFARSDIEAICRDSREPVSSNISSDLARAIKKGWIMLHNQKKGGNETYRITSKGEEVIKNNFDKRGR
ncbi:MAG TPA: hypothetical protein VND15_00935 [Candidatus Acidoferrales bacterium]|nr:hypothetical protein [Candidatus Acidoferrales bacterium]